MRGLGVRSFKGSHEGACRRWSQRDRRRRGQEGRARGSRGVACPERRGTKMICSEVRGYSDRGARDGRGIQARIDNDDDGERDGKASPCRVDAGQSIPRTDGSVCNARRARAGRVRGDGAEKQFDGWIRQGFAPYIVRVRDVKYCSEA